MKSNPFFLIKAYLPDGRLIKSKPVRLELWHVYLKMKLDLELLGCDSFYLTTPTTKRFIKLNKPFNPSTLPTSVIK